MEPIGSEAKTPFPVSSPRHVYASSGSQAAHLGAGIGRRQTSLENLKTPGFKGPISFAGVQSLKSNAQAKIKDKFASPAGPAMARSERKGPDFRLRTEKVVNRYSYTLGNANPNSRGSKQHLANQGKAASALILQKNAKSIKTLEARGSKQQISEVPSMFKRNSHKSPSKRLSAQVKQEARPLSKGSFDNDVKPYFKQYDREQQEDDEGPQRAAQQLSIEQIEVSHEFQNAKRQKVSRPSQLISYAAGEKEHQMRKWGRPSFVGPTISSSRFSALLPSINQRRDSMVGGSVIEESAFRSNSSNLLQEPIGGDMGPMQYVSSGERPSILQHMELEVDQARRNSVSMAAGETENLAAQRDSRLSNQSAGRRDQLVRSTSKQELCERLDFLQRRQRDGSQDRLTNLYALLQSGEKGASRLGSQRREPFGERVKMSKEVAHRVAAVNSHMAMLQQKGGQHHKDSLSRLSAAIVQFRQHQRSSYGGAKAGPDELGMPLADMLILKDSADLSQSNVMLGKDGSPRRNLLKRDSSHLQGVKFDESTMLSEQSTRAGNQRRFSKNLKDMKKVSRAKEEEDDDDSPAFEFHDNIDVLNLIRLAQKHPQTRFRVKAGQLADALKPRTPFVFEGPFLRRCTAEEASKQGFWQKLLLTGSGQPVARENAALMSYMENGLQVLYVLGGSPMISGQFGFEIFKVWPSKNTWAKVTCEKPIVQTIGARPVVEKCPYNTWFKVFYFSGMVPLQRINSGVKVCPPDLHRLDSETLSWHRVKDNSGPSGFQVTGRKNHAMSVLDGQVFVTGGMDNGQKLLAEFLVFSLEECVWQELKQVRTKKQKMTSSRTNEASVGAQTESLASPRLPTQLTQRSELTEVALPQIPNSHSPRPQITMTQTVSKGRRRLLRRSHHSVVTIRGGSEKLKSGFKIDFYHSFVFGGLIEEGDGRLSPTNDLIEVVTRKVVRDPTHPEGDLATKPNNFYTQADEAVVTMVRERGGIKPLPRRDHSALLIRGNTYMLIYGGKNDSAFAYSEKMAADDLDGQAGSPNASSIRREEVTATSLGDIMLFCFETREWSAVSQRGFGPDPRWGAAVCYSESTEQLFVFGGTGAAGSCRNEVFCCEMGQDRATFKLHEYQQYAKEVELISKRMRTKHVSQF